MGKLLLLALLLFSFLPHAYAAEVELRCKGTTYWYENGFGVGFPIRADATRIVRIDLKRSELKTDTLYGERITKVEIDERYYSATLTHDIEHKGVLIRGERMLIERYTGEMSSVYVLSNIPEEKGYMAFVGECQKAERKF